MPKRIEREHEYLLDEIVGHGLAPEVPQTVEADPLAEPSTQLGLSLAVTDACANSPGEFGICKLPGDHRMSG